MKIGLDLDGVCYKWESTARYMIRQRMVARGAPIPAALYEVSEKWDWIQANADPLDWAWLWTGAIEKGLFRYGHIVEGAIEGVQEITALGETTVITARPKGAVHDTMAWLELMFDKAPLAGVVIQSDGQKKSEVVPTPDVYIDDATHNYDDILANTDAYVIQFVQPWNEHYTVPIRYLGRVLRAGNWREIVSAVRWVKEQAV